VPNYYLLRYAHPCWSPAVVYLGVGGNEVKAQSGIFKWVEHEEGQKMVIELYMMNRENK